MKDKTALKAVPKTEEKPDPQVLDLAEHFQNKMRREVARRAMDLIHRANDLDDPVLVERWALRQVYELLYSIELIVEPFQHKDNEDGNIYYMLRPHMTKFTELFEEEGNLSCVHQRRKVGGAR